MKTVVGILSFVFCLTVYSQAASQMRILDLDPAIVGPRERQTWARIYNRPNNQVITLKVFRVETKEDPLVDGLRHYALRWKARMDLLIPVKKTWFPRSPKPGDYTFRIELLDQRDDSQDNRNLVVQLAAFSARFYYDDSASYAETSLKLGFDNAVLVEGKVKNVEGRSVIITDYRGRSLKTTFAPFEKSKRAPKEGTKISAYISKSSTGLVIRDFETSRQWK